MTDRYRLVFHGQYAPGANPADVITRLTELLSSTRMRVSALLARPPATILHDLELAVAKEHYFTLSDLGLRTILEPDVAPPPPPAWDGVERRMGERRRSEDRRRGEREHKGEDRRKGDRRKG